MLRLATPAERAGDVTKQGGDWWTDRPWRLIQTNLREIDMADIRAGRVVADLRSFGATAVMINAAGIIASYPTKLPFHFQSPYLSGDSLGTIIDACHAADIRVIARTDFSKVRRPLHEANPDWAYRTAAGRIVDYNGDVHVCPNGAYQQELALRIIEECLTELPFDGIFFNMGGFVTRDYSGHQHGPCHCASCRRRFRAMFGGELADHVGSADYARFCRACNRELGERYVRRITAIRPDVCIANHTFAERGFIRMESNTGIGRPLPRWMYQAGDNTRRARCNHPDMVASNTTVDFIDFPYRHVTVSPHLQSLRLAQNLAAGGSLDWYLIGRIDNHRDRSGFEAVRRIFAYHAANEAEYIGLASAARIALLEAGRTGEYAGWYRALVEYHHPFDVLNTGKAADLSWDRYDLLILPDLDELDEPLAERIAAWVEGGGRLIVTGRTGLGDLLGITGDLAAVEPTDSTYFEIDDKAAWPRFADVDLIYQHGPRWAATYADDCRGLLRTIPPHHFGPPERCYFTEVTGAPGAVVRRVGRGSAIHLPWLPGRMYWEQGWPNTAMAMADLIEARAGIRPIGGNLSPMVELTHLRRRDGTADLVHLVNHSGHFGISWHAPVTMADLRLEMPFDAAPRRVRSLPAGADRDHAFADGLLTIHVPALGEFEALRIDR